MNPLVELFDYTKKPFKVVCTHYIECSALCFSVHYCCLCVAYLKTLKYCFDRCADYGGGGTEGSTIDATLRVKVPFQRRRQGHNVLALLPFQTKQNKKNVKKIPRTNLLRAHQLVTIGRPAVGF